MYSTDPLLDFVVRQIDDEWDRLISECSAIPLHEFRWRPGHRRHSIAWHVRHVAEWRYALVHVLICGKANEEQLTCLGWEHEPLIERISANSGWADPEFTVEETLAYTSKVREITNEDILALTPTIYGLEVTFPWRRTRIIDEIVQDTRHSSLHRGHVRELRRTFAGYRFDSKRSCSNDEISGLPQELGVNL